MGNVVITQVEAEQFSAFVVKEIMPKVGTVVDEGFADAITDEALTGQLGKEFQTALWHLWVYAGLLREAERRVNRRKAEADAGLDPS